MSMAIAAGAAGAVETLFHTSTNIADYLSFINPLTLRTRRRPPHTHHNDNDTHTSLSNLDIDVMEIILNRLNLVDRFNTSLVCKSWQFMVKHIQVPPQLPWMLLPTDKGQKLAFIDLFQSDIHHLTLPNPRRQGLCCGSSKGWLIIATETDISEIILYNPLSGATHTLPPLSTLSCFDQYKRHNYKSKAISYFIRKIELSSSDVLYCTVAGLFRLNDKLAFCKVGNKSWTLFDDARFISSQPCPYIDILVSTRSNTHTLVYVLSRTHTGHAEENVKADTCILSDFHQVTIKLIPAFNNRRSLGIPDGAVINYEIEYDDGHLLIVKEHYALYLVENPTNGELLLIKKNSDVFVTRDDHVDPPLVVRYFRTSDFKIYKIDPNTGISYKEKLKSFGRQVLFLSRCTGSSFVDPKDFAGLQENCIYFVEDNTYLRAHNPFNISRDSGIFYLENQRIVRCFPSVQLPLQSCMGWFMPNLG